MSFPAHVRHDFSRPGERRLRLSVFDFLQPPPPPTPFPFFSFWLQFPSHLGQFTPFNSRYLSSTVNISLFWAPDTFPFYYLNFPFCLFLSAFPLSFSPSCPALTIFVCGSSLQHLINSYSPPPSFTPFQEPHNKCRAEGTHGGDLH